MFELDWEYYRKLRHDFHAMPELGYREFRTADRICRELESYDIPYERGIGGTGVVARIRKGSCRRGIALRADMDALPITEETGLDYASKTPGIMHACGHDGHIVMLLAAAKVLRQSTEFDGTAVLIFQPAEEGGGGARAMMDDGLFERFPIDAVYGLHTRPDRPLGTFLVKDGPVMTSVDTWSVTIRGRSGHSARPHLAVNPILVASHLVQAIKEISATAVDPLQAHVVTVATIESGVAFNVIPDRCRIGGSVRTFSPEVAETVKTQIARLSEAIAGGFGAEAEFDYTYRYPATVNNRAQTALRAALSCVGEEKVVRDFSPSMGSEDFSFYLQQAPGCYVWLGSRADSSEEPASLHSCRYDFNDDLIATGASYWVELVRQELSGNC